jgi:Tn3 transposase DDE domain
LNKSEAKNVLARAVFFNRLGELRDRTFENQRYQVFQEIFAERLFIQRRVADTLLFAICYLLSGRASGESGKAT